MRTSGPLILFFISIILCVLGGGAFLAGLAMHSGSAVLVGSTIYLVAAALVALAFWLGGEHIG